MELQAIKMLKNISFDNFSLRKLLSCDSYSWKLTKHSKFVNRFVRLTLEKCQNYVTIMLWNNNHGIVWTWTPTTNQSTKPTNIHPYTHAKTMVMSLSCNVIKIIFFQHFTDFSCPLLLLLLLLLFSMVFNAHGRIFFS